MNIDKEIKLISKDFPKKRTELRIALYLKLFERIDKLFKSLDEIQGSAYVDKYLAILSNVLPKMNEENFQFDGETPVLQFNIVDKLNPNTIHTQINSDNEIEIDE